MAERFRSQPLTRGDILREVRASGHVEAVSTVSVGAEVSGRIAAVQADFNDRVRAGQVVARFDRTALMSQLAQTRAMSAAARAALAQALFDFEHSQLARQRADALLASGQMSQAEHESATTAASLAQARLDAARAQVAAQDAAFSLARTNLDHAVIRSPIDGVVITRNVDPGQTVASMLQTPVLFTIAADLRRMRVIAAVDEADIGDLAAGQRATFTVNAYPNRTFEGLVTEVRNSPVIVQDVVTYGAVVEVRNDDLALKPGMTASVRIRTAMAPDVLRAPNTALHFTPPTEQRIGSESALWVLRGQRLHRFVVQTGISDGESTAIAAGPLDAGAQVLVDLTPQGKAIYGVDRTP